MSKTTASAAGGAMPASGQPNIAEAFEQTRLLIIAASNIAAAIDDTQAQGLHTVIITAEDKFKVAFDWFKAGHVSLIASPAHPDPDRELLHIVDDIDEVRYLIEATWMAVDNLSDREAQNPLHAVLSIAKRKLTGARDKLNIIRRTPRRSPLIRSSL